MRSIIFILTIAAFGTLATISVAGLSSIRSQQIAASTADLGLPILENH